MDTYAAAQINKGTLDEARIHMGTSFDTIFFSTLVN